MPLMQVDLDEDGRISRADTVDATRADALATALAKALAGVPAQAPVAVLVHGFRYSPRARQSSPHAHILGFEPAAGAVRALSWPRALGFDPVDPGPGLVIGLGWEARGSLWGAFRRAAAAGAGLAAWVEALGRARPGRPVDIVAHSLGARVALAALPGLPAGAVGRMILIAPAALAPQAERVLATPAGRAAEIVAITSGENLLFDAGLALLLGRRPAKALGLHWRRGCGMANGTAIRLDCPQSLAGLAAMGFAIAPPARRICHWSGYLRPGVFALYRALLRERPRTSPAHLRAALPTEAITAPRRRNRRLPPAAPPRHAPAEPS